MTAVAGRSLAEGQAQALEALHFIARASDGALMVDLDYEQTDGDLDVRVYLSSASLLCSERGANLEDWEPIDIAIPDDFPYTSPIASTGRDDFPDLPHQAWGSKFCVRVEDSNWDPAAGMPGFLRAVIDTYQHIALGTLQGHLQSWRPLVHYPGEGCAVIKADLPATSRAEPETPLRWAAAIQANENRIDIVEWLDVSYDADSPANLTDTLTGELARIKAKLPDAFLVPAVVIAKPIALEYSGFWLELIYMLQEHNVEGAQLLVHLAHAATINQLPGQPQPAGRKRTALVFRVAGDTQPIATDQDARFAVARLTQRDTERVSATYATESNTDSREQILEEFFGAAVPWVRVYDGRPESVQRRSAGRPAEKLTGSRILLLGCGGLGAPIAEHCVRAGATHVHIVDSGTVSPGILSRQPYEDADVGQPKATILAGRLARIRTETGVTSSVADIVFSDIFSASHLGQYDLIIDATANRSVAAKIERSQRDGPDPWPALVTVAISQHATHGVAAVTPRGAVGAGIDLLRQLGLKTCTTSQMGDVYAEFFPTQARRLNFRPDTSCSDITFIGSTTDIGALAAQLLDSALARLDPQPGAIGTRSPHRSLTVVRLGGDDEPKAGRAVLVLPPDRVVIDHGPRTYEVRIDEAAMEIIRGRISSSAKGNAPGAGHTGGLLLGQFDSVCRIVWVSHATGLPPGSIADPVQIKLDDDEVRDRLGEHSRRSGGMLTLIGFWHTHVGSAVAPSEADKATMQELVTSPEWRSPQALLLVLGLPEDGSTGEPPAPWDPEIHAETFAI